MYMISIHAVVHLPAYAIYLDFFLLWKRSRLVDSDLTVASVLKHIGLEVHGYLTQCPPTPPIPPMRSQPAQKSFENHRPRLTSYTIKDMVIIPIPPQYSRRPRTNTLTLVTPMQCSARPAGSRLPALCLLWKPKHSGAANSLEDAECNPSSLLFHHAQRILTLKHGLNRNSRPFTAFSTAHYRTSSSSRRHHGAPAVANREHAPVWPQATLKATFSLAVWCWKDIS